LSATRLYSSSSSSSKGVFSITTPIYYVNGQPHLGHAYTSVVSDILARFHRKDGLDVFFLTGTDEHGQKVEQSALASNKSPIQFADEVSLRFRTLADTLGCTHDDFIRTTEERHKASVAALWKRLEENGQIYLGAYEGWYSIRDEAFYSDSELVEGKAPTGAEVTWVKEESYFFRLSDYTQKLLAFYEANPDFIAPKGRRSEVISFVGQEGGLKDLSISRTTFSWGIPVPGDPKHVIYVWLDALANYISALEYPNEEAAKYKTFWPASLHIVGKDILRFHAVFWPAFLMAANIELPKRVFAHGWWTKDGEKMSKSVGNVLDPFDLLNTYGLDYLRYFMVAEVPFGNDGDFSSEAFAIRCNADLADDVGNLAQRVLIMVQKNCDNKIPAPGPLTAEDVALLAAAEEALGLARKQVEVQNLKGMCETIIAVSKLGNKYIDVQAPWSLRKNDVPRMYTVLYVLAETIRKIAILLEPVVPRSSGIILDQLGVTEESGLRSFASFSRKIEPGTVIGVPSPVFPKIEQEKVDKTVAAKPAPAASSTSTSTSTTSIAIAIAQMPLSEVSARIVEVGGKIRELKAAKADKTDIKVLVDELVSLKEAFKAKNGGVAYDAAKV